ncbi:phosphoenolpyruvate hydrolase family protein [Roseomonas sp. CCTCC AB2023176]|uniref:phosphoenolpyruvate hydrolase family protein n=1 Tax=Roseomonas sp. CCTCC AB2023176 TaxID=3342640 RepID=UPI0035DF45D0
MPAPRRLTVIADLQRVPAGRRRDAIFLPALAPFPPALWPLAGLLPILDINGTLRDALAGRPAPRSAAPIAGIFACDPFLRVADLAPVLRRAGILEVANFPTVQAHAGDTAEALRSLGLRAEAEYRVLARFAEHGLSPIACATGREAAAAAIAAGLRRILLHPGIEPPADPARWWSDLAGFVAVEGGEPLAWADPPQGRRSRRRIRL